MGSWDLDLDLSGSQALDFIIMANRAFQFACFFHKSLLGK